MTTKEIRDKFTEITKKQYREIKKVRKVKLNFPDLEGLDFVNEPFSLKEGSYDVRVFKMYKRIPKRHPNYYQELYREYEFLAIGDTDIIFLDTKYLDLSAPLRKPKKPVKGIEFEFVGAAHGNEYGKLTSDEIAEISSNLQKNAFYLAEVSNTEFVSNTKSKIANRYVVVYHGNYFGRAGRLLWSHPFKSSIKDAYDELNEFNYVSRSGISRMKIILGERSAIELRKSIKEEFPEEFL